MAGLIELVMEGPPPKEQKCPAEGDRFYDHCKEGRKHYLLSLDWDCLGPRRAEAMRQALSLDTDGKPLVGVGKVPSWLTEANAAALQGAPCMKDVKVDLACRHCKPTPKAKPTKELEAKAAEAAAAEAHLKTLSDDFVALNLEGFGNVTLGFYPNAAPRTVAHLLKLFRLGCYNTNQVFRVDKGFVAQVSQVEAASTLSPLSAECEAEGAKTLPAEFTPLPHKRGVLSLARHDDPDSGTSSFFIVLGRAAHLDKQYAVFGEVVEGEDVLARLEEVEVAKEGIFVKPTERVTISSAEIVRRRKVE